MERDTAKHVWVKELAQGTLTKTEDSPSAITLKNGTKIYRARIYGTVVSTDELIVDDSTGSVLVRSFDKPFTAKLGELVLVIGRPRMYNNQHYILGEIVKKVDPAWAVLAKKQHPITLKETQPLDIIRKLDKGDGADYEEVIAKLGSKGEQTVTHMLAMGELFETRPGKLKVLE